MRYESDGLILTIKTYMRKNALKPFQVATHIVGGKAEGYATVSLEQLLTCNS